MSTRTTALKNRTGAKVVGSLGVVGAAAAIAGMGTFGTFTDSSEAIDSDVSTGVVSIRLGQAANVATAPLVAGGFAPGDSTAMPFDVINDGTLDWSSVDFTSWATTSSRLDTDRANGLQLTLESCPVSWTVAGPGTYSCGAGATEMYSGPVIVDQPLEGASSLTVGGVDHVLATIELPETAGNTLQAQRTAVSFTLTAVQRNGGAR